MCNYFNFSISFSELETFTLNLKISTGIQLTLKNIYTCPLECNEMKKFQKSIRKLAKTEP